MSADAARIDVQTLYDLAKDQIEQHNAVMDAELRIDYDKFLRSLKLRGGTTPEALSKVSYEVITDCLPEFEGVKPDALARAIGDAFRAAFKEPKSQDGYVSGKKAERMTVAELLAAFDIYDPTSAVGKRLQNMSKGERFIVFRDGVVLLDETATLLQEIRQNYPGRQNYKGFPLYKVGEFPDKYVDENPLYPGRPLRPDGTCDQLNRSWQGVPLRVRQLIYLAVKGGSVNLVKDSSNLLGHSIFDMAVSEKAWESLTDRLANPLVQYNRLEGLGELPKLKVPVRIVQEKNNPFEGGVLIDVKTVPQNLSNPNDSIGTWTSGIRSPNSYYQPSTTEGFTWTLANGRTSL